MSHLVQNSHLISDFLGYFPSFHDDKIQSFHFDARNKIVLMEILTAQWTDQVDERGYFIFGKYGVITMQFEEVSDMQLEVELINIISEIDFEQQESNILTDIYGSVGIGGKIVSKVVRVLSVQETEKWV